MGSKHYIAFDLGASSGRAVHGMFDGRELELEEIHRFPNTMVRLLDHLHWDVPRLFEEMKHALGLYAKRHGSNLESVGVDTWGVDFALIGRNRTLLGLPYAYRDHQTDGIMEIAFELMPREEIFSRTGIQFMQFNTLFQLLALVRSNSPLLDVAERLLMIPDLFNFLLTGEQVAEFTEATTSQCYDPRAGEWAWSLLERLGIPNRIMPEIIPPGTVLGDLLSHISEETGIGRVSVVAPACHDTGSAVASVPARGEGWAYLSSGTWSLMGIEVVEPVINELSLSYNFTNEGGVGGTFRLLKNITGLWLIQECRRIWARMGEELSYDEITAMASEAEPFVSMIDPDHPSFLNPPDMPEAIAKFCRETGQPTPDTKAKVARTVFESLALKCRMVLEMLRELKGGPISVIHIVGGGTKNRLLCQFTANATGLPVVAGPVEATAIGNILVQAMAQGEIGSVGELREVVRRSFPLDEYQPEDVESWEDAYGRFREILKGAG